MYEEQSVSVSDFPQTLPQPFNQIPALWLGVTQMTEGFFAQEAPRASGSNMLVSVLILAVVTAALSAISSVIGNIAKMATMPAAYTGDAKILDC